MHLKKKTKSETINNDGLEDLFSNSKQLPIKQLETVREQNLVRSEMHMFLWPYFLLEKKADRFKMIEVTDIVKKGNEEIQRKWQVIPHPELGLPGAFDGKVKLALYSMACEKYLLKGLPVPDKMPIGNWQDLFSRLNISNCGKNTNLLKQSLNRLMKTLCVSDKAFLHKTKNLFVSESFTVLRSIGIKGEKNDDGEKISESFVSFHPYILDNLNACYLQILDNNMLNRLNTDVAKHLYPLLSYWFYRNRPKNIWRVEYKWLAQRLGIKLNTETWKAKNQLKKSHQELVDNQYISKIEWNKNIITYHAGPAFQGEQLRKKHNHPNEPKQLSLDLKIANTQDQDDNLLFALNTWAIGLPFAAKKLKIAGLSEKQAEALCIEKGIEITRKPD